jgi:ParB-like chromosome segregation protein Spo0J
MILDGVRRVPLSKIRLPGDFKSLLSDPFVAELADSLDENGLIHYPVLERDSLEVVTGMHRIAAHALRKRKSVEVRLWVGDAREREMLTLAENLHRKERDRSELRRRYVEAKAAELAEAPPSEAPPRRGRPVSPKGEAIRQVAAELGVSERTVRRDMEAPKEVEPEPKAEAKAAPATDIKTWGHAARPERLQSFQRVRDVLSELAAQSSQMLAAVTRLQRSTLPVDEVVLGDLIDALKEAGVSARHWLPVGICPYCRDEDTKRLACGACAGLGWTNKVGLEGCPVELLGGETP